MWLEFDDESTVDEGNLEKIVTCLTGEKDDTRLTPEEMRQLINNVSLPSHDQLNKVRVKFAWRCLKGADE